MGVITKRETKKGVSYRAVIRKKGENTITKTFLKRAHALTWIAKTEADLELGAYREDKNTLGVLIQRYITEIHKIKPFGRSKMCTLLQLSSQMGHYELRDLTADVYHKYAVGRGVHPSTVKMDMSYIGVVLNTAENLWRLKPKLDEYKKAVANLSRLGVISSSDERERRVSDDEVESILKHANCTIPLADIVKFALYTSMRVGEIASLRWSDIKDDGKSIIIRERKHPRKKKDQQVPLLPQAREIIQRQEVSESSALIPVGSNYNKDYARARDLIFPVNSKSVTHAFRRARIRADIEDLRFHDLRHEAISRLFELGLDSMVVAVFSGHRDINMLRRYTHVNANKVLQMLECNPIELEA
jgi:integrase